MGASTKKHKKESRKRDRSPDPRERETAESKCRKSEKNFSILDHEASSKILAGSSRSEREREKDRKDRHKKHKSDKTKRHESRHGTNRSGRSARDDYHSDSNLFKYQSVPIDLIDFPDNNTGSDVVEVVDPPPAPIISSKPPPAPSISSKPPPAPIISKPTKSPSPIPEGKIFFFHNVFS